MQSFLTISFLGLEASVQETIQATNYGEMLSSAHFLNAVVERMHKDEHTSLDVLFAYIHSMAPELRDWPYEAEDDWLLLDNLTLLAGKIEHVIKPMIPIGSVPRYHSHTDDSITMTITTPPAPFYGL
jgi:hypothetical protein